MQPPRFICKENSSRGLANMLQSRSNVLSLLESNTIREIFMMDESLANTRNRSMRSFVQIRQILFEYNRGLTDSHSLPNDRRS